MAKATHARQREKERERERERFIQEGNRAPALKATHARNWGERDLFKRETEHLCLRPPIHGIGRDPFAHE